MTETRTQTGAMSGPWDAGVVRWDDLTSEVIDSDGTVAIMMAPYGIDMLHIGPLVNGQYTVRVFPNGEGEHVEVKVEVR